MRSFRTAAFASCSPETEGLILRTGWMLVQLDAASSGRLERSRSEPKGIGLLQPAKALFLDFQARPFRPANEAYRCDTRRDLDRAILVELLPMPAAVLDSLDLLRAQWCAEPTVYGGKSTRIPPTEED